MRVIVSTYRYGCLVASVIGSAEPRESDLLRTLDRFERDYRNTFGITSVYRFNDETGPKIRTTRQPDGRHYVVEVGD